MNTILDVGAASIPSPRYSGGVTIHPRYNGPRRSANGGYASGMFAALLRGQATVVLRSRVPLGRALRAIPVDGGARVLRGRRLVAEVLVAEPLPVHTPPVVPTLAQAEAASRRHPFVDVRHPFDACFVCSPHRRDGLQVVPGPLADGVNGALFRTPRQWLLPPEVVWASLDCVSYPAADAAAGRLSLLGTLTVTQHRQIAGGELLAAVGWTRSTGNRSTATSSALVDEQGTVVASANAVWIALRRGVLGRGSR